MKFLSAKNRIALGLVCLTVSIMSAVAIFGLGPNARRATLHSRGQLGESVALNTSILLCQNDINRMKGVLTELVQRNDDIRSAGLRRHNGTMVVEVGDHNGHWNRNERHSTATQIMVSLQSGQSPWGVLEIRFAPLNDGGMAAWMINDQTVYLGLVAVISFFCYSFYLGRVLAVNDQTPGVGVNGTVVSDQQAAGRPEFACADTPINESLKRVENDPETASLADDIGQENRSVESGKRAVIQSSLPLDDEDFVRIARLFVDQLQNKLEKMNSAAAARDFEELFNLGHWLRGAGGSAGFELFNAPGKNLETLATAKDIELVLDQIQEISDMAQRIRVIPQTAIELKR